MFTQKLYKSGNSVAVTIPKQYLEDLNLNEDSEVMVVKKGKDLVISAKKADVASDVDAKFAKMVDEFVNEHEDVLKELSNR